MNEYLKLRVEALEREVKRLTQMIKQREKNKPGFRIDITDPVFYKPLNKEN